MTSLSGKRRKTEPSFAGQVGAKAARKLKARRNSAQGVWFGLGMMGLIGWSVAIPTLLGAALGIWLDQHYPGRHAWTLALLVAGLAIGCLNAWHWVAKEDKAIRDDRRITVNETLSLILAWAAGGLLGAIFFGGLWWTIGKGVSSKRPALWFFGSMLLRTSIALIGFYFVSGGHWERMLLCLLGFVLARLAVMWLTRLSGENQTLPAQEASHAP